MLQDKGLMLNLALFWGMVMVPTTPFWMLLPPPVQACDWMFWCG